MVNPPFENVVDCNFCLCKKNEEGLQKTKTGLLKFHLMCNKYLQQFSLITVGTSLKWICKM